MNSGELVGGLFTVMEKKEMMRMAVEMTGAHAHFTFESILGGEREPALGSAPCPHRGWKHGPGPASGETGTGKELFAQAIHNDGPRRNRPFVAINCGAIPKELLESELFGYEEGAFTGARRQGKAGMFELAHTGTLFLDEIGDLPLTLQGRLLRVLQERELVRVGGTQVIPLDVRVLCATHQDLRQLVAEERFRADLFYRLNVLSLRLPPLRERLEDIVDLAVSHLREHLDEPPAESLLVSQLERPLLRHPWPGNIRELRNVLIRALQPAGQAARQITLTDLPSELRQQAVAESAGTDGKLQSVVKNSEAQTIILALGDHHWNVAKTARALGISRASMYEKMRKFSIKRPPDGF